MEFDNLYCRSILYLQENPFRGTPMLGIGDIKSLQMLKYSTTVIALMLITEERRIIPPREIKAGKAIKVIEAVEGRPESLSNAVMSWVVLSNEETPTTLLLHKGLNPEEVKTMCFTRVMREIPTDRLNNQAVQEARDLANQFSLTEPEKLDFAKVDN
jgi:hypothetical protein